MKLIPLTQGQFAKVDDEDFEKFSAFSWRALKTPRGFYAVRSHGRDTIYLHREVMNTPPSLDTDHENRDKLDCQKSNLRICTRSRNMMNRFGPNKNTRSGIRGVNWRPDKGKWRARIKVNYRSIFLGHFDSKEEALAAYRAGAAKYHGEFAGAV